MAQIIFFLFAAVLASAQTRIASVGNSITYGYSFANRATEPYPAVLQTLLGSNYSVSNFGVSGTTMLKLGDNPYWTQSAYTNAKTFLPNIVVIELGTNDSKDWNWYVRPTEFPVDYATMIAEFRALSSAPEVWVCLAHYSNNDEWKIRDTAITKRINPDILQVALEKGAHVIDLHSTFTDHSLIMNDSVHPTVAGAAKLAEIIRDHLLRDTLTIHQAATLLSAPAGQGYQWYKDGTPLSGATEQTLTITATGSYMASIKVDADKDSRIVTSSLKVTDLAANNGDPYSSATSASSSGGASPTLNGNAPARWLQLSGNNLRIQLQKNSRIALTIYDIQGNKLQQTSWQGYAGMNIYQMLSHKGLRIIQVQAGREQQTMLLR